jgi:hypothetical protein
VAKSAKPRSSVSQPRSVQAAGKARDKKHAENFARIATFRAPTEDEAAAINAATVRKANRPARAAVRSEKTGDHAASMWPIHSDGEGFGEQMRDTFGSSSNDFTNAVMTRMEPVLRDRGEPLAPDVRTNAALAVMGAIAPQNELEALIGEQIITTHVLSVDLMGRAKQADTIPKMEAYVNMATKLSRTTATQVEALSRLRSGGKQQVVVKHVYVNGPAIVGDHAQAMIGPRGGGSEHETFGQSHTPTDFAGPAPAQYAALRGPDTVGKPLPESSGAQPVPLQDARRVRRGPDRIRERELHLRPVDEGTA